MDRIEGATVKKESKLELPLWLSIVLAQRDIVEIRTPQYLTEKYIANVRADSEVVNFRL